MESESSPLENVNTPMEIDLSTLNLTTTSVPSVISISDSDEEINFYDDVIVIDSDDDEIEMHRKSLDRYNRRLKYKMRRAINILLRYNNHLSKKERSYLEKKKDIMRCEKSDRVVENAVNQVSRVESERSRSEIHNLRGLKTLRRRYQEAIKKSYEIIGIWLSHDFEVCGVTNNGCMEWATQFLLDDNYVSVDRGPDGEIASNDLDFIIQDADFSDSESSSGESVISVESEHPSPDTYFDNSECHERPYHTNDNNLTYNHQNIVMRGHQRSQQRKQRLKRRQQLRNRFKTLHRQCYSPADDQDTCVDDEQPHRRNSGGTVETNSLSSETATSSSHAIADNLLASPVMLGQRRSRSRTRNLSRPRRFCSLSPTSSSARIIPQDEARGKSRSPLPTRPLAHANPSPSPSSPPDTATPATNNGASTVTGATAGGPRSSQSPPEALGSTLQRVSTDDDTTATLSQAALTLLELSKQ